MKTLTRRYKAGADVHPFAGKKLKKPGKSCK